MGVATMVAARGALPSDATQIRSKTAMTCKDLCHPEGQPAPRSIDPLVERGSRMALTTRHPGIFEAVNFLLHSSKVCRRCWSLNLAQMAAVIFTALPRSVRAAQNISAYSRAMSSIGGRPTKTVAAVCDTVRYALIAIGRNALSISACLLLEAAKASTHTSAPYRATARTVFAYSRRTLPLGPPRLGKRRPNMVALSPARLAASARWPTKLHLPSRISLR